MKTPISKREKLLGISLILILTGSFGVLYYFERITLDTEFVIVDKYPLVNLEQPINPLYNKDTKELFILEQTGKVKIITDGGDQIYTALDLSMNDSFHIDFEGGLLGMEFDPLFDTNGFIYLFYTVRDRRNETLEGCGPCVTSILSRFVYDRTSHEFEVDTEFVILEIPQFSSVHRSGQLNFNSIDGMLYVNIGDSNIGGGSLFNIYGKILRIDVSESKESQPYSIPTDNPFYNNSKGYIEEIYAYGLRNPWRASFDLETNTFWVADVGHLLFEELNKVEAGLNYGWWNTEGEVCRIPGCNLSEYELPILSYSHNESNDPDIPSGLAIIGGYIYRGNDYPSLFGKYIFGDFTGDVWAVTLDENYEKVVSTKLLGVVPSYLTSIGIDSSGELIFAGHSDGKIYHLQKREQFILYAILIALGLYMTSFLIVSFISYYRIRRNNLEFKFTQFSKILLWRAFEVSSSIYLLYIGYRYGLLLLL